MKKYLSYLFLSCFTLFAFVSCDKKPANHNNFEVEEATKTVQFATGFSIEPYEGFTVVRVSNPWTGSRQEQVYVAVKEGVEVPDSLQSYTKIQVPVKNLVVTSTTHLPALELLNEVEALSGFPGLNYISSPPIRARITQGEVVELGEAEQLNTEKILELQPDVVVGFAMDSEPKSLSLLKQLGVNVVYNGDWLEQNPLGKAEWIKFFGVLFDKQAQADRLFNHIAAEYVDVLKLLETEMHKPTVFSGVMFQDVWYMPKGDSWAATFFQHAVSNYLWKDTAGEGSLALPFESVFERAQKADFWINPGHYESLQALSDANSHYASFEAFKKGQVYSFAPVKGESGGTVFYEVGPTRPDLVLKDLVYILHPERLPNHELVFYRQLK